MNDIFVNADGTKVWVTDNNLHKSGHYNEVKTIHFVEIISPKLKRAIAKVSGLESWIVLPIEGR